jgi:hypothetical protein
MKPGTAVYGCGGEPQHASRPFEGRADRVWPRRTARSLVPSACSRQGRIPQMAWHSAKPARRFPPADQLLASDQAARFRWKIQVSNPTFLGCKFAETPSACGRRPVCEISHTGYTFFRHFPDAAGPQSIGSGAGRGQLDALLCSSATSIPA